MQLDDSVDLGSITQQGKHCPVIMLNIKMQEQSNAPDRAALTHKGYDLLDAISVDLYEQSPRDQLKLLMPKLKEAIMVVKRKKARLLITSFLPFHNDSSLALLRLLQDDIDFDFLDYRSFSKNNLNDYIAILEKAREIKKQENNSDQQERTANPKSHHLNDPGTRYYSTRRKVQAALLDVNNRAALDTIAEITRKDEPVTLAEIAARLNIKGIPTNRGKKHTAKSVSRLKHKLEEITDRFRPVPAMELKAGEYMNADGVRNDPKFKNIPLNWEDTVPDFSDEIVLSLAHPLQVDINVTLSDNQPDGDQGYSFTTALPAGDTALKIDILQETALLPGRHYIKFEAEGYESKYLPLTLYQETYGSTSKPS